MFKDVPTKVDFVAQEHDVLRFWKETNAFNKLVALRVNGPRWSFIDGPITANNPMGVHHGWGRTYKDVFHRYWAMRGYRTRYQNGFDCQGLWVEVEVERDLGFRSKQDIEAYGMARFVRRCKERVLRFAAVQTEQSIRLGYWMDWNDPQMLRELADRLAENPEAVITVPGPQGPVTDSVERIVARLGLPELGGSYFTLSNENNYMIWTFLKRCWERGWLYKHADVMPWCPRCATGISQHEIATDGYVEMTHPGVTLRFPLRGRPGEALLVWTTTPWTLTSNIAAAVGPDLDYVRVRQGDEVFYLSRGTVGMLRGDYEVLAELKGREMEGWTYDGPFDELPAQQQPGGLTELASLIEGIEVTAAEAHRIILWDGVGEAEGTGIVHIATGCGAEDFQLGLEHKLPIVVPLNDEGIFVDGFAWLTGRPVAEVAQPIFEDLRQKGLLYSVDDYTHRYPVCWRCGTELVFRLVDEWFISMDELRYDIMEVTRQIRWIPAFGLERELDWLRNMHDWMISKKRYWGLALPIWEYPDGTFEVIGSREELKARAVEGWEAFEGHTPHRPHIDRVKIRHPQTGLIGTRIPDVGNPWLDAGIVAYSTVRYGEDPAYWRTWFPADFITESFPGQFRNWFYSLIAMSTVLERKPPTRTVLGFATLLDAQGRPMHKSSGNMIEFNEAADRAGADVMRWLYARQPYDDNLWFGWEALDEVRRATIIPLWNVYSFFVSYAIIDGWQPAATTEVVTAHDAPPSSLDRWILARLAQLVGQAVEALDAYDARTAALAIEKFIDDLSNWYVRRSRRRFWRSGTDEDSRADKAAAYSTLHQVLLTLCRLMAPFTPFLTEAMWQNLAHGRNVQDADASAESVHHTAYPEPRPLSEEEQRLLREMAVARATVNLGHSARAQAGFKVRQPLARALVVADEASRAAIQAQEEIIADELNVKRIEFAARESDLVRYRVLPDNRKLGPRYGPRFPKLRAALEAQDAAEVARLVKAGQPVPLEVDGQPVSLGADEVLVQASPREGLVVAGDGGVVVALDTSLTLELVNEGLAREVVRRINELRKSAGLNLSDRIVATYRATPKLSAAIEAFSEYITGETLSLELRAGQPTEEWSNEDTFDGESLTIGIKRAG